MIDTTLKNFLAMGGYGFYVWASYGIVFIVLIALLLFTLRQKKVLFNQKRRGTEASIITPHPSPTRMN